MKKVSAIVLAAGLSSRMGQFKLLLDYKGTKVLNYIIETLLDSVVSEIIVVTGHNSDIVSKELACYNIKNVFNSDYKKGMHTSVMCGVRNINNNADAFMIVLGDQPPINSTLINNIVEYWYNSAKGITIPSFNNKKGHPVIFDSKYISQAINLNPELGLRKLINDNKEDIDYLIVHSDNILFDIDTPEDYKALLKY